MAVWCDSARFCKKQLLQWRHLLASPGRGPRPALCPRVSCGAYETAGAALPFVLCWLVCDDPSLQQVLVCLSVISSVFLGLEFLRLLAYVSLELS